MSTYANIVAQVVTDDLLTFVLDDSNNSLSKIEYTGEVVNGITFAPTDTFNDYSLHVSPDREIVVYSYIAKKVYYINPISMRIRKVCDAPVNAGTKMIFDIYGNKIFGSWISAAVDNENNIYTVESTTNAADYKKLGFQDGISWNGLDSVVTNIVKSGFTNVVFVTNTSLIEQYEGDENDPCDCGDNGGILLPNAEYEKTPLVFTDRFFEEQQFPVLYENSPANGILSKPFNPQSVFIDKDNKLLITNDTREVLKLSIGDNRPVLFEEKYNLFDSPNYTGANLTDSIIRIIDLVPQYEEYRSEPSWQSVSAQAIDTVNIDATYELNPATDVFETYYWIVDSNEKAMYKINAPSFTIIDCFSLPEAMNGVLFPNETYSQYRFTLPPASTYTWSRKFDWLKNNKEEYGFSAYIYTLDENQDPVRHTLTLGEDLLANNLWYHVALTYDYDTGHIILYLDNEILAEKYITPQSEIYSFYEAGGVVGAKLLRSNPIDDELRCNVYTFNGRIYDMRLYDYTLSQSRLAQIILSDLKVDPLEWNIPVGPRQYIEKIERFFMNRAPGHSSQFYKIRLVGFQITDPAVRQNIEEIIRTTVLRVAPAYATLYKIDWDSESGQALTPTSDPLTLTPQFVPELGTL